MILTEELSLHKKTVGNLYPLYLSTVLLLLFLIGINLTSLAQSISSDDTATEEDYYKIVTVPTPPDIILEVSGMDLQPNGDLVVTTRFGDIWLIQNPYREGKTMPHFKKIATGLHTPMGIASKDGKFYVAQRSELTEMADTDGDEIIDQFRTFCTFEMSGNYCEYVHGPIILPDGNFWVNMNLADNNAYVGYEPFYSGMGHNVPWKGWIMLISPEGELIPYASGLRSPPGMGIGADGTMYYSENQGEWVATGYVTTVNEGDFFGHPASLKSSSLPGSTTDLQSSDIPYQDSLLIHEAAKKIPGYTMPSVRLPHGVMGTSLSWILEDTTGGSFGPFEGQIFVADQGHNKIMRVFTEEVKGKIQGAAFQFREGFQSGIVRSTWGIDGSMFVGMTDRGWRSLGPETKGLQRLVWTGNVPFEVKAIRAKSDGFELEFTQPVDPATARSTKSYQVSSFDYLYRKEYGSPIVDKKDSSIQAVTLSKDRLKARLILDGEMRAGYIYQITTHEVLSTDGQNVLHPEAFYSLNQIPEKKKTGIHKE